MSVTRPSSRSIGAKPITIRSTQVPCTVHPDKQVHGARKTSDDEKNCAPDSPVTTQVRVQAYLKNRDTGKFWTQIKFRDIQNNMATVSLLRGASASQTVKELLEFGANLPAGFDGIIPLDPTAPVREGSGRTGWHPDKLQFLMPRGSVGGGDAPLHFIADGKLMSARGQTKGKSISWRQGLSEPLACSSYLKLALACVFTAPMLELTDVEETMSFNIFGPSGAGKTLSFKAAESAMGPCSEKNLVTLNLTDRALNDQMYAHNGMPMFINELKNADSRLKEKLTSLSHVLTSGTGFDRSNYAKRVNSDLEKRNWTVLGVTNFEKSLEDISGGSRDGGERARHIDIPVPAPADGGIFDLRDRSQPTAKEMKRLVGKIVNTIDENHGFAFKRFLRFVIRNVQSAKKTFAEMTNQFINKVVLNKDDSWYVRFARKFGYVYAGGILAIKAGVLPITAASLFSAIRKMHSLALSMFRHPEDIAKEVIENITHDLTNRARFPQIEIGEAAPTGYAQCDGFYRAKTKNGRVVALKGETLKVLCADNQIREMVVKILGANKALVGGRKDASTTQLKLKGAGRHGYYVLKIGALKAA